MHNLNSPEMRRHSLDFERVDPPLPIRTGMEYAAKLNRARLLERLTIRKLERRRLLRRGSCGLPGIEARGLDCRDLQPFGDNDYETLDGRSARVK